eukprot:s1099_g5.t2
MTLYDCMVSHLISLASIGRLLVSRQSRFGNQNLSCALRPCDVLSCRAVVAAPRDAMPQKWRSRPRPRGRGRGGASGALGEGVPFYATRLLVRPPKPNACCCAQAPDTRHRRRVCVRKHLVK